ncbi:sigma-70 family RNA polymerase sigma factor [Pedobacter duraquae]|uniref:RNA polymerase sigma-70 factor (ECF subfamily) n=1 Tax=Pedobacter duraquae TaxID=425511 RepID=A0A4R6IL90_9SPHI|nr:sigma-70 family RNA polymerase sigma factor [Pedobacter duraquae]TDO22890.1 RNA polymerase sigma-70 factor (ECF subfamily) [Pedobacter duraquae]
MDIKVTDSDLLKSICNDDERAFSELFHRYSGKIYAKSFAYLRDAETCEQIVHDVFLTIWNNRKTLQIESFVGYITAAARYRVYKQIAVLKLLPLDYKEDIELHSIERVNNGGEELLAYSDMKTALDLQLQKLPKRCREIFILSRFQMMTNDEIAEKLGIDKRTVENQLTRALKFLRLSFKDLAVLTVILMDIFNS